MTLIGEIRAKVDELRPVLEEAAGDFRDDVTQLVNDLSAKVDELQAAWEERRAQ